VTISRQGTAANWVDTANWLTWRFKASRAGEFDVKVILGAVGHRAGAPGGQAHGPGRGEETGGQRLLTCTEKVDSPRAQYYPSSPRRLAASASTNGYGEPGVRAEAIGKDVHSGLTVASVQLVPRSRGQAASVGRDSIASSG